MIIIVSCVCCNNSLWQMALLGLVRSMLYVMMESPVCPVKLNKDATILMLFCKSKSLACFRRCNLSKIRSLSAVR